MQRAEESAKAMNPTKVFLTLAGILAAASAVFFLTRPDTPTPAAPETNPPNFSLTDEEAVARVESLQRLKIRAYRNADELLFPQIFTQDSPSSELARKDFEKLRESDARFYGSFKTQELSIRENSSQKIVVRQEVIVIPSVVTSSGEQLASRQKQVQVVDWVLHLEDGRWLVYETIVQKSQKL